MRFTNVQDEMAFSRKRFKLRRDIEGIILDKEYFNYEPKLIEDYDRYLQMNQNANRQSIVKVMPINGHIAILRPDITTSLLNELLPRWEKDLQIKLFYYGKIFKQSQSKVKEIRQMGVEWLGCDSFQSDTEMIYLANQILGRYRNQYLIEIGSSEYLKGLLKELYLEQQEYKQIIHCIDRKDYSGLKEVIKGFERNAPYEALKEIFDLKGDVDTVVKRARQRFLNPRMEKGLNQIESISNYQKSQSYQGQLICDLSMVSSLGYYSGLMFRGYYRDSNREILKGGRYDSYYEDYGNMIPAIGFSVEIDELMRVLYEGGEI